MRTSGRMLCGTPFIGTSSGRFSAQLATNPEGARKARPSRIAGSWWESGNRHIAERPSGSSLTSEVQEKCPTISDRDLSRTVQVLAKLEQKAGCGYDLLSQLAACSPDDSGHSGTRLMQRWTASVTLRLYWTNSDRSLKLRLRRMEKLVENPDGLITNCMTSSNRFSSWKAVDIWAGVQGAGGTFARIEDWPRSSASSWSGADYKLPTAEA